MVASTVEPPDYTGRVIAERILLKECIGGGGMGWVYAAHHLTLDKSIAVKVLKQGRDPAHSARFVREARSTSKLDHPNIVSILDFGEDGDDKLLYLAMEEIEGVTLAGVLERGPLPPGKAVDLMLQTLSALAHAHRNGIVHRDLKPANVMIMRRENDDGQVVDFVKVLDFGLVKLLRSDEQNQALTRRGATVGTPEYMSPEQCIGSTVDARTDIYSCGAILFEMVAGRPPFVGEDAGTLVLAHLHHSPPPLESLVPDVDPELASVVEWALEKRVSTRCPSAIEFRRALSRTRTNPFDVSTVIDASSFRRAVSASSSLLVAATPAVLPFVEDAPSPSSLDAVTEDVARPLDSSSDADGVVILSAVDMPAAEVEELDEERPFWLWSQREQLVGPMSYGAASRTISGAVQDGVTNRMYVTADCRTWKSISEFARLTEQEGAVASAPDVSLDDATEAPLAIFARVAHQRSTGSVLIESGVEWAEIEVTAGAPTRVRSSDPTMQVPHLLVDRGFLQRDMLTTIIHEALKKEVSIVDVLAPLVDVALLERALIREQISRLFAWSDSRAGFDASRPIRPRAPRVDSMLEGVVSLVALGVPLDRLRDRVAPFWTHPLRRTSTFDATVNALQLLPGEATIVDKLDGATSAANVLDGTTGFGKAQIALVFTLIETGALAADEVSY